MATEAISDVDTIIEDDVEDVGELELEEEDEEELQPASRPVRRAAAVTEEVEESMGLRAALIGTALVMLLAMPVCLATSTGNLSSIAKSIAGIFFDLG